MQFEEDIPPCRSPRKSSRPPESLQKTRYATSRNPRNGAAILAVSRLNLLCSCSVKNNPAGTTETLHPDLGDSSHGPHWDYGKYGPGGNRTGRIYPNPNDPGGSCTLES